LSLAEKIVNQPTNESFSSHLKNQISKSTGLSRVGGRVRERESACLVSRSPPGSYGFLRSRGDRYDSTISLPLPLLIEIVNKDTQNPECDPNNTHNRRWLSREPGSTVFHGRSPLKIISIMTGYLPWALVTHSPPPPPRLVPLAAARRHRDVDAHRLPWAPPRLTNNRDGPLRTRAGIRRSRK
jgi:hypothetical protein